LIENIEQNTAWREIIYFGFTMLKRFLLPGRPGSFEMTPYIVMQALAKQSLIFALQKTY
jgi:hypothetical protein